MTLQDIYLRKVEIRDIDDVFRLSNEDYVRKYSINKDKIKWEDHVKWFERIIQSPDDLFYVITNPDNTFLGQIRYKIEDAEATVSVSLSKEILGKGLSYPLIKRSLEMLKNDSGKINKVIAFISKENIPSQKLFTKAGFVLDSKEQNMYKFIYTS